MIRVLHAGKFYAPAPGGLERAVQDMAEGLRGEYDVRVLAFSHRGPRAVDDVGGVPVFRASTFGTLFSQPLSLQFYPLFRRLAREADLVHFHHPSPLAEISGLLDGCERKAVVVSYHSDIVRQRWAMPVYAPVLRALLRRADRITVSSERLRDCSPYLGDFRSKCAVVPYGIRVEETTSGVDAFEPPARDYVLFVGRLVAYKGVNVLIRAMRDVPAPLVVVGDGPLRAGLQRLARDEGVAGRVHFLGALPTARVRACFSRCRVFALPSVLPSEAFGIVQLEAMAFGKPVVNTDLPSSVPEVSPHDVTGLTVPPGNPVAMAEAITRILADPERYGRYSRNALARARELSMERFLDGVRRVYREALGER